MHGGLRPYSVFAWEGRWWEGERWLLACSNSCNFGYVRQRGTSSGVDFSSVLAPTTPSPQVSRANMLQPGALFFLLAYGLHDMVGLAISGGSHPGRIQCA